MLDISVTLDTSDLERGLRGFAKQIPFATAMAMTKTAQSARKYLRQKMRTEYTIRDKRFMLGSMRTGGTIRVTPARKQDYPRIWAEVGSIDEFMARHSTGGVKKPETGVLAIPTKVIRRTKRQKITPAKRPAKLLKKKNFFIGKSKRGTVGVWKSYKKKPPALAYLFKRQARIPATWPFERHVEYAVSKRIHPNMMDALEYAIKTAR